jgi:hypothetical protein
MYIICSCSFTYICALRKIVASLNYKPVLLVLPPSALGAELTLSLVLVDFGIICICICVSPNQNLHFD